MTRPSSFLHHLIVLHTHSKGTCTPSITVLWSLLHIVLGYLLGLSLQVLGLSQRVSLGICLGYLSECLGLLLVVICPGFPGIISEEFDVIFLFDFVKFSG